MGAEQSKVPDEKVFQAHAELPISFSPDVINHLSDSLSSPGTDPARQSTLDEHVRERINSELEHLRHEEQAVREQIERALERENLDRESSIAQAGASDDERGGKPASSDILRGDLEEIQNKAQQFHERRQLTDLPEVKEKQEALVQCYTSNPTTPLDCWHAVDAFKDVVAQVERKFVDSLR
ncbi:hypothetical protein BOTBODRAFT_34527 [Botryobasidium botryosum FD-172 SS1]|uniref:DUF1690 domain-containing protein n=1 Tax=Botryobasidium botryosum (strain FD-172 SS1) TaxID=930990 RepID=A0A067MC32_BOTB1|nr:hypothetical protein BOTBODRAFT_34527 [Botryobasidium botryosum FD-172 SS1]